MIKKYLQHTFLFMLFLLLTVAFCHPASAKSTSIIADNAKILTTEEAKKLADYCTTIETQSNTSIYIITHDGIGMSDDFEGYMESIGNAADAPRNLVLLFIGTKPNDRVFQIFGYGKAETFMNDDRCNHVMDLMESDMHNGDYFQAVKTFCEEVQRYLSKDPRFDSPVFHPLAHLIAALLISVLVIWGMVRNTAGRNTTTSATYIDKNHSRLLGRIDHYTHMTVQRVKKSSNSSGGSSGGGKSHSSGNARSF